MSDRKRMRLGVTLLFGVVMALLGPKLTGPHDEEAKEPFSYEPPAGFVENVGQTSGIVDMTGNAPKLTRPPAGEREWFQAPSGASSIAPDVRLTHSKNKGTVEPVDLRRIADGMPAMLAEEGVTWSTLRTETRVRADGAHVGLIEGECTKTGAGLPGLATEARYRRLMFAFPDNDGMSIVVAVYGADEASRWQPVMESSITSARGVAKRFPPPPPWMRVAWGVAGSIVGYLVFALLTR